MSDRGKSRAVRTRLVETLRRELMGPTSDDETITEYPTSRYVVGRLAPARATDDDQDAAISDAENDTLGAGSADDESGEDEPPPPLIIGFNPSSFGLSFIVDEKVTALHARVSWGDYKRETASSGSPIWRRLARHGLVEGINVKRTGAIDRILLSESASNEPGVQVTGVHDSEIALEGVIHEFAGYRAVSLFLVNRRTKGALNDRSKDERWIFQPRLVVTTQDGGASFLSKDSRSDAALTPNDGEASLNELLYRHAREFATGHGVAAGWRTSQQTDRAAEIFSEFIPEHEVPLLIAQTEDAGGATLDMKTIANAQTSQEIRQHLEPMLAAYEQWIDRVERASHADDIHSDSQLRDAAENNVDACRSCALRMRAGLDLLEQDQNAFRAFAFANHAMWDQRVHSLWAASNRKTGIIGGSASTFDVPNNRVWRPFQMGFILLNLVGLAREESPDRQLVDLLWFPTGGGKTEAYLGLSAFTLALRRLRGDQRGMVGSAGVSIIMRYTLRLLTVQQFQRAAALICACEVSRREEPQVWGTTPFEIGVWVGRGTTPNTFADSQKALEDINEGKKPRGGSPIQLVSCPRCGAALVSAKGVPIARTYQLDTTAQRTLVWCSNEECEFAPVNSDGHGLPVVVVDDEIYRACPSLVVATVDKFARIPFKGETRALFGMRNRFSPTYGHLTEAHGNSVGGRKLRDATPALRLLPPELVIQDELHLISGPLGTMVGLYETAVDYASSIVEKSRARIPAKVIASTATIRRAAQQTHQLYGGRRLAVFPPSGIDARDSFFAREIASKPEADGTAGRLYLGINAPGSSTKTLLVRVYAAILAAAGTELQTDPLAADPYGTLVGYFNSMRALGGAKRLVEDDVSLVRLKYLTQHGFPRRYISDPEELTSRIDSWRIPSLLERLDNPFPRGKRDWPVDVLLATNMISVGVDIDRLGLMVVTGQPKATAEYIQASSRVGRKHPGLVITMYNWMGARDLSHYERFESYHSALNRHVEAISVTPFSSRALDRGLRGVFAGMNRLFGRQMSAENEAENFNATASETTDVIEEICQRAASVVGKSESDRVRERLVSYRDDWAHLSGDLLRYSWLDDLSRPQNNSRVLLRTAGTQNEGEWSTPGSLREVEPTAAFFVDEID